jgi:hypothetical protein
MASNLIQIKRSQSTATPGSLANGELAFTAAGNVVFIGNYGQVLPIGGQRNPGILTANQALVANSTSGINEVIASNGTFTTINTNSISATSANITSITATSLSVTNAAITSITANGTTGSDGSVLAINSSGQVYWSSTAAVNPSYVQNTDSRTLSGNLYFSGANTYIDNLNVGTINRSPKLTLSGDATGNVTFNNLGDATLNVTITNANGVTLGVDTEGAYVANVVAGGGVLITSAGGATSTPTISANVDNSTIEVFGGALRVKDDGIALGTKTTGDYVASITSGNGIMMSTSSGEGSTPTIAIKLGTSSGLISNTSGLFVDPAAGTTYDSLTVAGQTTLNGNVVLGDAIQDRVTLNGSLYGTVIPTSDNSFNIGTVGAVYNTGYFTQLQLGSSSDTTVTAAANTIQVYGLTVNSNFISNTATIYHDLYVGGDVHITGNAVYSNVESYIVTDPLIQLAANNTNTDLLDIGFFGNYNVGGGAHEHTGFFRDASDGIYKIFDGLQVTPTTFVDTANNTYNQATLQAYLNSGALVSNGTNLNITATSGLAVAIQANTLTLSTPLAASSGGTGFKTYTGGQLLVGNVASGLVKLDPGAAGTFLQSDGYNLYYSSLDGGTF